ncbi:uncharacterized protein AB675_9608 [Cyphellophora attinorum]|uniref:Peptidase S8/S53 domain-containing protein n=1 Tax=Cyphellophora attinorum TaxID=1664694 RepID=A0A0N1P1L8_9EURO|nr:uncharacterized protein AB675_9608 [Phialophora attinorum]KPI42412.1 hypothetical protein AB675_9608 [Phialophora attinorum]
MDESPEMQAWKALDKQAYKAYKNKAYPTAIKLYQEFEEVTRKRLDPMNINVLWSKCNYCLALTKDGKFEDAYKVQEELLSRLYHTRSEEGQKLELVQEILVQRYQRAKTLNVPEEDLSKVTQARDLLLATAIASTHILGKAHPSTQKLRRAYTTAGNNVLYRNTLSPKSMSSPLQNQDHTRNRSADDSDLPPGNHRAFAERPSAAFSKTTERSLGPDQHGFAAPVSLFHTSNEDGTKDQNEATDKWFQHLAKARQILGTTGADLKFGPSKNPRIAILDTGFDSSHPDIQTLLSVASDSLKIRKSKSWLSDNQASGKLLPGDADDCGHGTRMTWIAHRVAPFADFYIARIFRDARPEPAHIAKAIEWAVEKWNVDIISMSFGLADEDEDSIDNVTKTIDKFRGRVLFFAAGHNSGLTIERSFPARHDAVFCVHSADHNGIDSKANPGVPFNDESPISALGEYVPVPAPRPNWDHVGAPDRAPTRSSGTSVATVVAAAIAAHVLYFIRKDAVRDHFTDLPRVKERVMTKKGMRAVFKLMRIPQQAPGTCLNLQPWHLFKRFHRESEGHFHSFIARQIERAVIAA